MTTGRINQVTIFEGPSPKYVGPSPGRPGSELVLGGVRIPGRALTSESNRWARNHDHPFAPTEFSKAGSAKEPTDKSRTFACPPQKEAICRRSRPTRDGYRYAKRTPNCVLRLIANGQQSTDSFGAGQPIIGRAGFGYSARFTWRVST